MTCTGLNYLHIGYYNIWLVGLSPFWHLLFKWLAFQTDEHRHSFFGVALCLNLFHSLYGNWHVTCLFNVFEVSLYLL